MKHLNQKAEAPSRIGKPATALFVAAVLSTLVGGKTLAQTAKSPAPPAEKSADADSSAQAKKPAPKKRPPEPPIEMVPYRVRVSVAFSNDHQHTPAFRRRVLREVKNAVASAYGQMWSLDVRLNDWIPFASQAGLELVTPENIIDRFLPSEPGARLPFDKLFLLTVSRSGSTFSLAGREWDSKSRLIGPVETASTTQPREVGRRLFSMLPRLFHPVLRIDRVGPTDVSLRLQAASFPAVDPELAQIKTGDVLVPFFRYLDKTKTLKRIRHVDWTYISVENIDGQYVSGVQIMDRLGRLGTGRTRGVEIYATLLRPRLPYSRLKMVYQTDESKPLVGYHINLVAKKFYRDKAASLPIKRYSGRDGVVEIPVIEAFPIVWVYVYSGGALLARVPYVPGVTHDETIALPDDSIRLGVEGEISLLKGEVIDTVARRATLMALAKQIAQDEKIPEAKRAKMIEEKRDQIFAMPGIEEYQKRVDEIRGIAVDKATKLGNKFAVRKIKSICNKTDRIIERFLDKKPVRTFFKQLDEGEDLSTGSKQP